MARDSYTTEIAHINAMLPQLLGNILTPAHADGNVPLHYLLIVNGRVPLGEKPRRSPAACRSALRRILRRQLYHFVYYPQQRQGLEMPWSRWKCYERPALEQVIKQMEERGVVEYRALDFDRTNTGLTS